MKYFAALVHHEEGSAFGLTFPDLPGCFSAADSWDDIPAKAAEAIDLWFEDSPEVEPRSLELIQTMPEVKDGIRDGASLILVPYVRADGAVVRANISIDKGLLAAIDETAKARRMTRSAFLAAIARREITGV